MSDEHGSDFVDELMEFLLRNYYSMMIKRVKRFFPNKFDAEDIVTETIIVLLKTKVPLQRMRHRLSGCKQRSPIV